MKRSHKVLLSLVLSLLLHIMLLGLGAYWSYKTPHEPVLKVSEPLEVTIVDDKGHGYRIADIQPPEKEERPDQAKFVGLYDSSVPQEAVAPTRKPAKHGIEMKAGEKRLERPDVKTAQGPLEREKAAGEGPKLAMKAPEKKVSEKPSEKAPGEGAKNSSGGDGEDYFETGLSEDYFPDYKVADHTYLNVLRFPKVGYFVRLKKIFRTTFNPMPALRQAYMGMQVSKGQVDVVMAVAVDGSGKLAELKIIKSSGIEGYDREAMRTVRDSAPFTAPPAELMNAPHELRMAWTFTVFL